MNDDTRDLILKLARCWKGYEPVPGKKPYSEDSCRPIGSKKKKKEKKADTACSCGCGDTVKTCKCGPDCKCRKPGGSCYSGEKSAGSPAWQRSEGKNDEGGLNAKGRASYNKATGGHLKAPVTESNPTGDRAKRQNSFCSRMCGMKKHETGSKTKKDPDSRINKSLRKWNCKCSSAMEFGIKLAQQMGQPASPATPQYSDVPFDRDYAMAAFKQHHIPVNENATDQKLFNQYVRLGQLGPKTPKHLLPFATMVNDHHGGLPVRPIQPNIASTSPAATAAAAPPAPAQAAPVVQTPAAQAEAPLILPPAAPAQAAPVVQTPAAQAEAPLILPPSAPPTSRPAPSTLAINNLNHLNQMATAPLPTPKPLVPNLLSKNKPPVSKPQLPQKGVNFMSR